MRNVFKRQKMSYESAKPLESLRMTFSTPYQTLNCHINIKRSKISFKQWRITQRKGKRIHHPQESRTPLKRQKNASRESERSHSLSRVPNQFQKARLISKTLRALLKAPSGLRKFKITSMTAESILTSFTSIE